MRLKIVKADNYDSIKQALEEKTGGNCPCLPRYVWNEDTICMCKQFREQDHEGECHCGAFKKIFVEEEGK